MRLIRVAAVLAATLLAALTSATQAQEPLKVIYFPGSSALPFYIGIEKGFFTKYGAPIALTPTPNSVFLVTNLMANKFDLALALVDNVVGYQEDQGEVKLDTPPDMFAFLGYNYSEVSIVSIPEVKTFADLKGRELSVDALTTGYAFMLVEILKRKGLQPGDYRLVSVGGTPQRAQALAEKKQAATSLTPPFDVGLMARGFTRLAGSTEIVGKLEGGVAVARRAWARNNEAKIVGFTRATIDSVNWMFDRANKDEAIAILRKYLPQTTPDAAAASYELQFDPVRGTKKTIGIDMDALRNVMAIRSAYAEPKKSLTDPNRYVDLSYLQKAAMR